MEPVKIMEDGLLLRSWQPDDARAVYLACQDPLIQRWTSVPSPYRSEHAETFVSELVPRALASDIAAHLGVFDEQSGQLLGACGLIGLDLTTGTGEIGYWTAPWARGKGVAVRACRAVSRWGFDTLELYRITWHAVVGNHASRVVALRAGFRIDGVTRAGLRHPDGGWVDCWTGSLLADDPLAPGRTPPRESAPRAAAGRPPAAPPGGPDSLEALRAMAFGEPQPELTAVAPGGPIRLRPLRETDTDAIVAAHHDAKTIRWTSLPESYGQADAVFYVGPYAQSRWMRGEGAVFAIAEPDGQFVGSVELRISPIDPEVAEVGYLVAPKARGKGYAPTALRAMCEWGFEVLALERIEWRAYVGNASSRRVAEKAGFTIEGIARQGLRQRDMRRDVWVGAVLRPGSVTECTAGREDT